MGAAADDEVVLTNEVSVATLRRLASLGEAMMGGHLFHRHCSRRRRLTMPIRVVGATAFSHGQV